MHVHYPVILDASYLRHIYDQVSSISLRSHGREAFDASAPDQPKKRQGDQEPDDLERKVARDLLRRELSQNQLDRKVDSQLKGQVLRNLLNQRRQQSERHKQPAQ